MIYEIDFAILDFIQSLHTDILDKVFSFITHLGDRGHIWIALSVCLLFAKKYRRSGAYMLLTLLIVSLLTACIKEGVMRPRPFMLNEYVVTYIDKPKGYSFPSGHTSSSFSAAVFLWLSHKKAGYAAIFTAALIAFSRLYFYVHFPSDVFAGALLGSLAAFCVHSAQKRGEGQLK